MNPHREVDDVMLLVICNIIKYNIEKLYENQNTHSVSFFLFVFGEEN